MIETLNRQVSALIDKSDKVEAVALYEQAAQLYIAEGSPADAEVCQHMIEIVNEKSG